MVTSNQASNEIGGVGGGRGGQLHPLIDPEGHVGGADDGEGRRRSNPTHAAR